MCQQGVQHNNIETGVLKRQITCVSLLERQIRDFRRKFTSAFKEWLKLINTDNFADTRPPGQRA